MSRKYAIILLLITCIICFFGLVLPSSKTNTKENLENIYYEYNVVEKIVPSSYEQACDLLTSAEARLNSARSLEKSLTELGYTGDHPAAALAKTEIINALESYNYYGYYVEELKWDRYSRDYFSATYIWKYMKNLGLSDYVCAGIMGNIMAECGGQTLNLDVKLQTGIYYGICQWSPGYSSVQGQDLAYQCEFLFNGLAETMDRWGHLYSYNMNYEEFLKLTNYREVALCFAQCYERCASYTYEIRQNNAEVAYNYFVR